MLANVRAQQRGSGWFTWQRQLSAAAAVLVICVGVFAAYQLGHLRWTTASQESFIASLSWRVSGIMRVGLREHMHCSVFRKYPDHPRPLEAVRRRLPEAYQPMIPMLAAHVPKELHVAIAHECGYDDRDVVHIGLKSRSQLMSLIITRKRAGDRFTADHATAVLAAADAPVFTADAQRFQIGALESREYLVYLVSDLGKEENAQIMLALAPQVRSFLDTLGSWSALKAFQPALPSGPAFLLRENSFADEVGLCIQCCAQRGGGLRSIGKGLQVARDFSVGICCTAASPPAVASSRVGYSGGLRA